MTNQRTRVIIVILLVIAAILSYVDRGNLSVVTDDIQAVFKIGKVQLGWLLSAFFWSYALCQIGAGWLTDRYDAKWVFAWGFLIWTLATLGTGLVSTFAALFAMRLLLGIGESVVYPAVSHIIVSHFPEDRRGVPNALIAAGTKIGPAISIALGGMIVHRWGWRELFVITGLVSLVWLIPWTLYVPRTRPVVDLDDPNAPTSHVESVSFAELLSRKEFWGSSLGLFSYGYTVYFLINWLPSYFEEGRGYSKVQMTTFAQIPFWVMAAVTVLTGYLGDGWIRRGGSVTLARMSMVVGGLIVCSIFMLGVPYAPSEMLCLTSLTIASMGLGAFSSTTWAITQTLSGDYAAGKWSGLQNAIGNIGGITSSILTGILLDRTNNSYSVPFVVAAGVAMIGVFGFLGLVGKVQPIQWKSRNLKSSGAY